MKIQVKQEWKKKIVEPEIVADIFRSVLSAEHEFDQDKEHVWILGLNTKNVIKYIEMVHLGSINHCTVGAREIFRMAVHKGINSIIMVHNHPSTGEIVPSSYDDTLTRKIQMAGEVLDIKLLDHVIVSDEDVYSYLEKGKL